MISATWWVRVAWVLAGIQVILGVGIGLDQEATDTERLATFGVLAAGAALTVAGIRLRGWQQRRMGDGLIAVGVVPSVLAGVVAFWFPPMWLITLAGIAVIAGAMRDAATPVRV